MVIYVNTNMDRYMNTDTDMGHRSVYKHGHIGHIHLVEAKILTQTHTCSSVNVHRQGHRNWVREGFKKS